MVGGTKGESSAKGGEGGGRAAKRRDVDLGKIGLACGEPWPFDGRGVWEARAKEGGEGGESSLPSNGSGPNGVGVVRSGDGGVKMR